MTDPHDRWRRIDELLEAALELSPEDRGAFLEKECGEDAGLREEVLALLELDSEVGEFLDQGPEVPTQLIDELAKELPLGGADVGATIGRYRVLSELGRGGMSTVYLAERADGEFEQQVALKILRSDLRTDELAARIRAERQILASLSHPNLAAVFDGGVTEDGRPYLVIEVVEGEPLDRYADGRALTVLERLDLFTQVCDAVTYAHRNLVVHRDLKPSNILVTEDGRVKLLDFGIAKLIDSSSSERPETRPATRWMTPEYAAPEQVLGHSVTTATDVHALGIILYGLLSGHRPFGDGGASGYVLEKSICEDLPQRPSTAAGRTVERGTGQATTRVTPELVAQARSTDPDRLRRTLDGDLDAVVLKCLRKEPDERYGSVDALLDELKRYRAGLPVLARGGAWPYRAKKFARRHWIGLSSAASFVALLLGSAIALSIQQAVTASERDRANEAAATAEREADNARLVTEFLADVFRGRDPTEAPADTLSARQLLEWGTERVESEFADRPDVQAELLSVMGGAHSNLGLLDEAIELHERSVALRREVYGDRDEQLAEGLGALNVAHRRNRDFEAALPLVREVLEIRRDVFEPDHPLIADALAGLGLVLRDLGRPDTAEVLLREALEIRARVQGEESADYTDGLLALAYVLRAQNKLDEAEVLYREAIPRKRARSGGPDSGLAVDLNNLAFLLRVKEDFAGAEPLYREAMEINAQLYGRGHPTTLLLGTNLLSVLDAMDRFEEADSLQLASVVAAEAQWPDGHSRVGHQYGALGRLRLNAGDAESAEEPLLEQIRILEQNSGLYANETSFARAELALAMILTGREQEGRPVLDELYRWVSFTRDEGGGAIDRSLAIEVSQLLFLLEGTGLLEDAERFRKLMPEGPEG